MIYLLYALIFLILLVFTIVYFTRSGVTADAGFFNLEYESEKVKERYEKFAASAANFWSDKLNSSHVITVKIFESSLGNGVLANAAITSFRGRLPSAGMVTISYSSFSRKSNTIKTNILKHEFGHIMGIGGTWTVTDPNSNPHIKSTTYPNALDGYKESTGYTNGKGVPVEDNYGSGSKHVHWEENDRVNFGTSGETAPGMYNELMTAVIKNTAVLSKASLGYLKDLGWDVDLSKAQSGVLFSTGVKTDYSHFEDFAIELNDEDFHICNH